MGAIAKVKAFFSRKPPVPVVERTPRKGDARFRVTREFEGETYEGYAGDDGTEAVLAWEQYLDSDYAEYPGVLRFSDSRHGVRGLVDRGSP
jgi:hypothetical protein